MPPLELLATTRRALRWAALTLTFTLMLVACACACSEREPRRDASPNTTPNTNGSVGAPRPACQPASSATHTAVKADSEHPPAVGAGNAERGKELVVTHECQRCHEGTGVASVARAAHCTSCHQEILAGT